VVANSLATCPTISVSDLEIVNSVGSGTYGTPQIIDATHFKIPVNTVTTEGNINVKIKQPTTDPTDLWQPASAKTEKLYKDTVAPNIAIVATARTNQYTGAFTFSSNEYGNYYYIVQPSTESAPTQQDIINGTAATDFTRATGGGSLAASGGTGGPYTLNSYRTVTVPTISDEQQTVYLVMEDANENAQYIKSTDNTNANYKYISPYIFMDVLDDTVSGKYNEEDTKYVHITLNNKVGSLVKENFTVIQTGDGQVSVGATSSPIAEPIKICPVDNPGCSTSDVWRIPLSVTAQGTVNIRFKNDGTSSYFFSTEEMPARVYLDFQNPVLSYFESTIDRTSTTNGTIKFNSDEEGTYYFKVGKAGDTAPTADAIISGADASRTGSASLASNNNSPKLDFSTSSNPLPSTGEKALIWVVLKDNSLGHNISPVLEVPINQYATWSVTGQNGVLNKHSTTQVQITFSLPLPSVPTLDFNSNGAGSTLNSVGNCGDADEKTWCVNTSRPTYITSDPITGTISNVTAAQTYVGTPSNSVQIHRNVDIPVVTISALSRTSAAAGSITFKATSATDLGQVRAEYSATDFDAEEPGSWVDLGNVNANSDITKALTFTDNHPKMIWVRVHDDEDPSPAAKQLVKGYTSLTSVSTDGTDQYVTTTYVQVQFTGDVDWAGAADSSYVKWSISGAASTSVLDYANIEDCPSHATGCYRIPVTTAVPGAFELSLTLDNYELVNNATSGNIYKDTIVPAITTTLNSKDYVMGSTGSFDPQDIATYISSAGYTISARWYNNSTASTVLSYKDRSDCDGTGVKINCYTLDWAAAKSTTSTGYKQAWMNNDCTAACEVAVEIPIYAYDNHSTPRSHTKTIKLIVKPGNFSKEPTLTFPDVPTTGTDANKIFFDKQAVPTLTGTFEFANGEKIERDNGTGLTGEIGSDEYITYQWYRKADNKPATAWEAFNDESITPTTITPTVDDANNNAQYQLSVRGYHSWQQTGVSRLDSPVMTVYKAEFTNVAPTFGTLKVGLTTLANDVNASTDAPWGLGITNFAANCRWVDVTHPENKISATAVEPCQTTLPKDNRGVPVLPVSTQIGNSFAFEVTLSAPGYATKIIETASKTVQYGSFDNTTSGPMNVVAEGSFEAFSNVDLTFTVPNPNPWAEKDQFGKFITNGKIECNIFATTNIVDPQNPTYVWNGTPIATIADCGKQPSDQLAAGATFGGNWTIPAGYVGKAIQVRMTASATNFETRTASSSPQIVSLAHFDNVGLDIIGSNLPFVAGALHEYKYITPYTKPLGFNVDCSILTSTSSVGAGATEDDTFFTEKSLCTDADWGQTGDDEFNLNYAMPVNRAGTYIQTKVVYTATDYEPLSVDNSWNLIDSAKFLGLTAENLESMTTQTSTARISVTIPSPNPRSITSGTAKCTWLKKTNLGAESAISSAGDCTSVQGQTQGMQAIQTRNLTADLLASTDSIALLIVVAAPGYTTTSYQTEWIELNKTAYLGVSLKPIDSAVAFNTSHFAINIPTDASDALYEAESPKTTVTCGLYVVNDSGTDQLANGDQIKDPTWNNNGTCNIEGADISAGIKQFSAIIDRSLVGKQIYFQIKVVDAENGYAIKLVNTTPITVQKTNFNPMSTSLSGTYQYKEAITAAGQAISHTVDGGSIGVEENDIINPYGGQFYCKWYVADNKDGLNATLITGPVNDDDTILDGCTSRKLTIGYNLVNKYVGYEYSITGASGFKDYATTINYKKVSAMKFTDYSSSLAHAGDKTNYLYKNESTMTITLPNVTGLVQPNVICQWVTANSAIAGDTEWANINGQFSGDDTATNYSSCTDEGSAWTGTGGLTTKLTPGTNLASRYVGLKWVISAKGYETTIVYPSLQQVALQEFSLSEVTISKTTTNYTVDASTQVSLNNLSDEYTAWTSWAWAYGEQNEDNLVNGVCYDVREVANQIPIAANSWDFTSKKMTPDHSMYNKCLALHIIVDKPGYQRGEMTDVFQVVQAATFTGFTPGTTSKVPKANVATDFSEVFVNADGDPIYEITPEHRGVASFKEWKYSSDCSTGWTNSISDYATYDYGSAGEGNGFWKITPKPAAAADNANNGGCFRAYFWLTADVEGGITANSYTTNDEYYYETKKVLLADWSELPDWTYPNPSPSVKPTDAAGMINFGVGDQIKLNGAINVLSTSWEYAATSEALTGGTGAALTGSLATLDTDNDGTPPSEYGSIKPTMNGTIEASTLYRKYVRVTFSLSATGYNNFTYVSDPVFVSSIVPITSTGVSIIGTPTTGQTLSLTDNDTIYDSSIKDSSRAYTYQWTIGGENGPTTSTLLMIPAYTGKAICATVTATQNSYYPSPRATSTCLNAEAAPTTITLTNIPTTNTYTYQNFTIGATISSNYSGAQIDGTLVIKSDGTAVGSAYAVTNGVVSGGANIPNIPTSGSHSLTAEFTPSSALQSTFDSSTTAAGTAITISKTPVNSFNCTYSTSPTTTSTNIPFTCTLAYQKPGTNAITSSGATELTYFDFGGAAVNGVEISQATTDAAQVMHTVTGYITGPLAYNTANSDLGTHTFALKETHPSLSMSTVTKRIAGTKNTPAIDTNYTDNTFTTATTNETTRPVVHGQYPNVPTGYITCTITLGAKQIAVLGGSTAGVISPIYSVPNIPDEHPNNAGVTLNIPQLIDSGEYTFTYVYTPASTENNFVTNTFIDKLQVGTSLATLHITDVPTDIDTYSSGKQIKGYISGSADTPGGTVQLTHSTSTTSCSPASNCYDEFTTTVDLTTGTNADWAYFTINLPHYKISNTYTFKLKYSGDDSYTMFEDDNTANIITVSKHDAALTAPTLSVASQNVQTTNQTSTTTFSSYPSWLATPSAQMQWETYIKNGGSWDSVATTSSSVTGTSSPTTTGTIPQKTVAGDYKVCAKYSGDASVLLLTSTPVCTEFTVAKVNQSMTFTLPTNTYTNTPTPTMTFNMGQRVPATGTINYTGQVDWSLHKCTTETCDVLETAVRTGTVSSVTAADNKFHQDFAQIKEGGFYKVKATFSGSSSFNDIAEITSDKFEVKKIDAIFDITGASKTLYTNTKDATYTLTVKDDNLLKVNFANGNIAITNSSIWPDSQATCTFSSTEETTKVCTFTIPQIVAAGTYTLTFTYSGDSAHNGKSQTANIVVNKIAPTISVTNNLASSHSDYYNPSENICITTTNTITDPAPKLTDNLVSVTLGAKTKTGNLQAQICFTSAEVANTTGNADPSGSYNLSVSYRNDPAYTDWSANYTNWATMGQTSLNPIKIHKEVVTFEYDTACSPYISTAGTTNTTDAKACIKVSTNAAVPSIDFSKMKMTATGTVGGQQKVYDLGAANVTTARTVDGTSIYYKFNTTFPRMVPGSYTIKFRYIGDANIYDTDVNEGSSTSLTAASPYVVSKYKITPVVSCNKTEWPYIANNISCTVKIQSDNFTSDANYATWAPTGELKLYFGATQVNTTHNLVRSEKGSFAFNISTQDFDNVQLGEHIVRTTYGGDSNLEPDDNYSSAEYKVSILQTPAILKSLSVDPDIHPTSNPNMEATRKQFHASYTLPTNYLGYNTSTFYTMPVITVTPNNGNPFNIEMSLTSDACIADVGSDPATETCYFYANVPVQLTPKTYTYVVNVESSYIKSLWSLTSPYEFEVTKTDPEFSIVPFSVAHPSSSIRSTDEDVKVAVNFSNIGGFKPTGNITIKVYTSDPTEYPKPNVLAGMGDPEAPNPSDRGGVLQPLNPSSAITYENPPRDQITLPVSQIKQCLNGEYPDPPDECDDFDPIEKTYFPKLIRKLGVGDYFFEIYYTGDDNYNETTSNASIAVTTISTQIKIETPEDHNTANATNVFEGCVYEVIGYESGSEGEILSSSPIGYTSGKIHIKLISLGNDSVIEETVGKLEPVDNGCFTYDLGQIEIAGNYSVNVKFNGDIYYSSVINDIYTYNINLSNATSFSLRLADNNTTFHTEAKQQNTIAKLVVPEGLSPAGGNVTYYVVGVDGKARENGVKFGIPPIIPADEILHTPALPDMTKIPAAQVDYNGDPISWAVSGTASTYPVTCSNQSGTPLCTTTWPQQLNYPDPGKYRVYAWYTGNQSLNPENIIFHTDSGSRVIDNYFEYSVTKTPTRMDSCTFEDEDFESYENKVDCLAGNESALWLNGSNFTTSDTIMNVGAYLHTSYLPRVHDWNDGVVDYSIIYRGPDGTWPDRPGSPVPGVDYAQILDSGNITRADICAADLTDEVACTANGETAEQIRYRKFQVNFAKFANIEGSYQVKFAFHDDLSLGDSSWTETFRVDKSPAKVTLSGIPSSVSTSSIGLTMTATPSALREPAAGAASKPPVSDATTDGIKTQTMTLIAPEACPQMTLTSNNIDGSAGSYTVGPQTSREFILPQLKCAGDWKIEVRYIGDKGLLSSDDSVSPTVPTGDPSTGVAVATTTINVAKTPSTVEILPFDQDIFVYNFIDVPVKVTSAPNVVPTGEIKLLIDEDDDIDDDPQSDWQVGALNADVLNDAGIYTFRIPRSALSVGQHTISLEYEGDESTTYGVSLEWEDASAGIRESGYVVQPGDVGDPTIDVAKYQPQIEISAVPLTDDEIYYDEDGETIITASARSDVEVVLITDCDSPEPNTDDFSVNLHNTAGETIDASIRDWIKITDEERDPRTTIPNPCVTAPDAGRAPAQGALAKYVYEAPLNRIMHGDLDYTFEIIYEGDDNMLPDSHITIDDPHDEHNENNVFMVAKTPTELELEMPDNPTVDTDVLEFKGTISARGYIPTGISYYTLDGPGLFNDVTAIPVVLQGQEDECEIDDICEAYAIFSLAQSAMAGDYAFSFTYGGDDSVRGVDGDDSFYVKRVLTRAVIDPLQTDLNTNTNTVHVSGQTLRDAHLAPTGDVRVTVTLNCNDPDPLPAEDTDDTGDSGDSGSDSGSDGSGGDSGDSGSDSGDEGSEGEDSEEPTGPVEGDWDYPGEEGTYEPNVESPNLDGCPFWTITTALDQGYFAVDVDTPTEELVGHDYTVTVEYLGDQNFFEYTGYFNQVIYWPVHFLHNDEELYLQNHRTYDWIEVPPAPKVEGKRFAGWYLTEKIPMCDPIVIDPESGEPVGPVTVNGQQVGIYTSQSYGSGPGSGSGSGSGTGLATGLGTQDEGDEDGDDEPSEGDEEPAPIPRCYIENHVPPPPPPPGPGDPGYPCTEDDSGCVPCPEGVDGEYGCTPEPCVELNEGDGSCLETEYYGGELVSHQFTVQSGADPGEPCDEDDSGCVPCPEGVDSDFGCVPEPCVILGEGDELGEGEIECEPVPCLYDIYGAPDCVPQPVGDRPTLDKPFDFERWTVYGEIFLETRYAPLNPAIKIQRDSSDVSVVLVGDYIHILGTDFAPFELLDVELHSSVFELGVVETDANGDFDYGVIIPDPNEHGDFYAEHSMWAIARTHIGDAENVKADIGIFVKPNPFCQWNDMLRADSFLCIDPALARTGVSLNGLGLYWTLLFLMLSSGASYGGYRLRVKNRDS
jgi:hypothetical protein